MTGTDLITEADRSILADIRSGIAFVSYHQSTGQTCRHANMVGTVSIGGSCGRVVAHCPSCGHACDKTFAVDPAWKQFLLAGQNSG